MKQNWKMKQNWVKQNWVGQYIIALIDRFSSLRKENKGIMGTSTNWRNKTHRLIYYGNILSSCELRSAQSEKICNGCHYEDRCKECDTLEEWWLKKTDQNCNDKFAINKYFVSKQSGCCSFVTDSESTLKLEIFYDSIFIVTILNLSRASVYC